MVWLQFGVPIHPSGQLQQTVQFWESIEPYQHDDMGSQNLEAQNPIISKNPLNLHGKSVRPQWPQWPRAACSSLGVPLVSHASLPPAPWPLRFAGKIRKSFTIPK